MAEESKAGMMVKAFVRGLLNTRHGRGHVKHAKPDDEEMPDGEKKEPSFKAVPKVVKPVVPVPKSTDLVKPPKKKDDDKRAGLQKPERPVTERAEREGDETMASHKLDGV